METPVNPPPAPGGAPLPSAELVVVNGRLGGVRRALAGPLTLLGRSPACEVRLNVEGVQPLHAALVQGPAGFVLRDLAGEGDVLVNNEAATHHPLCHGDVVAVGPFQFRLELTAALEEKTVEAGRDALRIQAAAVAAQQAALNEEEMRLEQRRIALEKQEEQLAAHLEERRRRLLELQEQLRQERETFQVERITTEQEQEALKRELREARDEAAAAGKRARTERQRLVELRKRLRRRWRRHWKAQEAVLARREKELTARENRLEKETANLGHVRAALTEDRLRLNGDVELSKRRMREQWEELALAQQQWEACINQEHAERERRQRDLDARAASVQEAQHAWAGRERSARLMLAALHREAAGLETRILNQRQKWAQEEAAVARPREVSVAPAAPVAVWPPVVAPPSTVEENTAALRRVAGELADQRAHLLEQWQILLQVQEEWRQERERVLAEMEAAGRTLHEREQRLSCHERELASALAECRQRQQSLGQLRFSLEGWQAILSARQTVWEGERAGLIAEVRAREEVAAGQLQRLQDLARQRERQRAREAEELDAARTRFEDLRRQYITLWEECEQRRQALAREQRDLAARALAVEQLRLEIAGDAPHSARAERRMERLRRRNAVRLEKSEREIDAAWKNLADEKARLEELTDRLQREQKELAGRREEMAREQTARQDRQAADADAEETRKRELECLQNRREQDERRIVQLRDEVERVAGLMMLDEPGAAPPAAQAA